MDPTAREYIPAGLEDYEVVDGKERVLEKELIYPDNFVIRNHDYSYQDFLQNKPGARDQLNVEEDAVRGWASTGNMMLKEGWEIPVVQGHDETKKQGKTLKFFHKLNKKGKNALYALLQFNEGVDIEEAKKKDISIYSPKEAEKDGKKYSWPITHIGVTKFPSIPELEPFRAIAASLLDEVNPVDPIKPTPKVELKDETLDTLLKKYGITVAENATDEDKRKAIADYLKSVSVQFKLPSESIIDSKADSTVPDKKVAASKTDEIKIPKVQLSMIGDARLTQLESLVQQNKITPAQRDKLKERYCTEEKVAIACSLESGDGFNDELETLKMNEPIKSGSSTGDQTVKLSQAGESLIEDAKRRAKEEEEKRRRMA